MALPEKEIQLNNTIETAGKVGQEVEVKMNESVETAQRSIDQNEQEKAVPLEALSFKKPETETNEKPQVSVDGKKTEDLVPVLANRIAKAKISEIETDPVINTIINQITEDLSNKDLKEEYIAKKISMIANNASSDDDGTYAWLQEKLESRVHDVIKNRPIM